MSSGPRVVSWLARIRGSRRSSSSTWQPPATKRPYTSVHNTLRRCSAMHVSIATSAAAAACAAYKLCVTREIHKLIYQECGNQSMQKSR